MESIRALDAQTLCIKAALLNMLASRKPVARADGMSSVTISWAGEHERGGGHSSLVLKFQVLAFTRKGSLQILHVIDYSSYLKPDHCFLHEFSETLEALTTLSQVGFVSLAFSFVHTIQACISRSDSSGAHIRWYWFPMQINRESWR